VSPSTARRRRGLPAAIWLGLVTLSTLAFRLWPQVDLTVAGWFYRPELAERFVGQTMPVVVTVYQVVPVIGRVLTFVCLLWVLVPARFMAQGWALRWRRRTAALLAVLVLGLGLSVNWALKEHVGRPRPVHITNFGGAQTYQPVGQVSRACDTNCSFVSGHAATGFVLLGIGLAAGRRARHRWMAWGTLAGALVGAGRILQGGHFLSDIVFAGLTIWGVALLVRALWVRARARRLRVRRGARLADT
jgi:lipid A 4'-phosphatase